MFFLLIFLFLSLVFWLLPPQLVFQVECAEASNSLKLRRSLLNRSFGHTTSLASFQVLGQAKVSNEESVGVLVNKYIIRFNVSVDQSSAVDVLQGTH